jgi:hypothetical protein
MSELPYHRWPVAYDPRDWKAGSLIRCEGEGCQWCASRWTLVDPHTLEDVHDRTDESRHRPGSHLSRPRHK